MRFHVVPASEEYMSVALFADSHNSLPSVVPVIDQGYDTSGMRRRLNDAPPSAESAARIPNGVDTQNNAADFQIATTPTPGATN